MKDLKKEKIAIKPESQDEANKVVDKLVEMGYNINNAFTDPKIWFQDSDKTLYRITEIGSILWLYTSVDAIEQGYSIITAKEFFSWFEEAKPKYGDKVWVRDSEKNEWKEGEFLGFIGSTCTAVFKEVFLFGNFKYYRTTDPANAVLTVSLEEVAEKFGVKKIVISNKSNQVTHFD